MWKQTHPRLVGNYSSVDTILSALLQCTGFLFGRHLAAETATSFLHVIIHLQHKDNIYNAVKYRLNKKPELNNIPTRI